MRSHSRLAFGLAALFALGTSAAAQETITLRSGVDPVTHLGNLTPDVPLALEPFTEGHFRFAVEGATSPVVVPHPVWVSTLSCDPDAQWISPGGSGQLVVGSGLFACQFEVRTPGDPLATIELCWAADDRLGDLDGEPNEAGLYLNGKPLADVFRGPDTTFGGSLEVSATQVHVPLRTGLNTLHLYQRDFGRGYSGLLFRCRVTVEGCLAEESCQSEPNSTGVAAELAAEGSLSVTGNDLTLVGTHCVPGEVVQAIYGAQPANLPFGDGVLCISPFHPGLIRLSPAGVADAAGGYVQQVDLERLPPEGQILGGSTWHFQLAYRDPAAGGAGFNLSNALRITFCP